MLACLSSVYWAKLTQLGLVENGYEPVLIAAFIQICIFNNLFDT